MNTTVISTPPSLKIFLVEDSQLLRERLTEMFSQIRGAEVVGYAEMEKNAISALKKVDWDLVILDIELLEGSGLGVLRDLSSSRPSGTTVVVFTNYPIAKYRTHCLKWGANYFFDKNNDLNQIQALVRDLAANTPESPAFH